VELLELIDGLMTKADPDGAAHARLTKLRSLVVDKVMLNPQDSKFLQRLVSLRDNIECANINNGVCMVPSATELMPDGRCQHTRRYSDCPWYEPVQIPLARGNPLKGTRR
jgi:hypothetical protein